MRPETPGTHLPPLTSIPQPVEPYRQHGLQGGEGSLQHGLRPARGHMPFAGHRTLREVLAGEDRMAHGRRFLGRS